MNREVEFRAWDIITNKLAEVEVLDFSTQTVKISFPCENDRHPETWFRKFDEVVFLEYTGFYDNNGAKIYEGDIVRIEKINCEVEWINGGLILHSLPRHTSRSRLGIAYHDCEILGNVFDNKELL